jgi:hypothetical protein
MRLVRSWAKSLPSALPTKSNLYAIGNRKANSRHPLEVRCWPTLRLVGAYAKRLASALSAAQSPVKVK